MPGYRNDVDGVDPNEDSAMGVPTGLGHLLEETGFRFTVRCGGSTETYGPFSANGLRFAVGYVSGWAAAHGYEEGDLEIEYDMVER